MLLEGLYGDGSTAVKQAKQPVISDNLKEKLFQDAFPIFSPDMIEQLEMPGLNNGKCILTFLFTGQIYRGKIHHAFNQKPRFLKLCAENKC